MGRLSQPIRRHAPRLFRSMSLIARLNNAHAQSGTQISLFLNPQTVLVPRGSLGVFFGLTLLPSIFLFEIFFFGQIMPTHTFTRWRTSASTITHYFFLGFDLCKGGDRERMPAGNPQSQKKCTAPKTVVAKTIYRPNLAMLTTNTNRQRGSRITPAASVIGSPIIGTHEAKRLIQPQR